LRGAVRVEVMSDDPERFVVGSVMFAEGDDRPLIVTWTGSAKPGLLLAFAEFSTREAAETLRDRYLEVVPLDPLPEGSYYWHQIRGLEVKTTADDVLGTVVDVFRAGEAEVYVVDGGPLGELMIPSVGSVVIELSPDEGRLVVDPVALDLPNTPPRRRRRHEVTRRDAKAAAKSVKAAVKSDRAKRKAAKSAGKTDAGNSDAGKSDAKNSDAGSSGEGHGDAAEDASDKS
jgi:16S rRNA processing protein RimM